MDPIGLREYRAQAAELIESGQPQAALRIAQHILRSFPHSLHGHCLLGRALLGLGRLDEAAAEFDWVLAVDPENVEASLGLASIYQKSGERQRAIEQLQYTFDLFPAEGALRERLNAVAEALAVAQTPGAFELSRVALARIYARNGLRAKAIQELQAVLAQQPQRHDVRLALAEALWQEGLHQEATEESQRVLAALPNALKANWIMAAAWLEKSHPEAAQPYLARAQALDPEHEMAAALFGAHSPVPPEHPTLAELAGDADRLSHPMVSALADASGRDVVDLTEVYEKEATIMSEPSPSEEPFEIPDWLKDLGDELLSEQPTAPEPVETPETSSGGAQAELPDWLQALIARAEAGGTEPVTTGEADVELPPWLAEIPPEETSVPPPAEVSSLSAVEELAWQGETAQTPEELPSRDTQAELPEWLREIQRGAMPAGAERATPATESVPLELPEWLRDETAADEVAPVQTDELPEWLRGEAEVTEPAPPAAPALEELPEWLREIEEEKPVAPAEMPLPTPGAAQPEAPTWLTEEVTAPEMTPPAEAPSTTLPEEEAPLPAWLQELRAAAPEYGATPGGESAAGTEEEEAQMPEWLRQLRAGIVEAPTLGTRELEEDLAKLSIVAPSEVSEVGAPPVSPLFPEEPPAEAPSESPAEVSVAAAEGMEEVAAAPVAETVEEVTAPPVEEVAVQPVVEEVLPAAAPVAEAMEEVTAPPVEEVAVQAVVEEVLPAAAPVAETVEEVTAPLVEEVAAQPVVEEVLPAAAPVAETVTALPEAPAERLALARKMALAGQWTEALSMYTSLVEASALLDSVISDLEEGIRRHPDDYHGYQLVGDAYAKGGRLAEALRAYRIALVKLQQSEPRA